MFTRFPRLLYALEWALRDTATDRAYGLDGVPGELAHFCSAELSKALFQLQLKSVFRLSEPIQHKGGVLHCVWKRKGPKQQCSSYRGILVSSVLGKSLHKLLRRHCIDPLTTVTFPPAGWGIAEVSGHGAGTRHPPVSVCLSLEGPVPWDSLP